MTVSGITKSCEALSPVRPTLKIHNIPDTLLQEIIGNLDYTCTSSMSLVCRNWRQLVLDSLPIFFLDIACLGRNLFTPSSTDHSWNSRPLYMMSHTTCILETAQHRVFAYNHGDAKILIVSNRGDIVAVEGQYFFKDAEYLYYTVATATGETAFCRSRIDQIDQNKGTLPLERVTAYESDSPYINLWSMDSKGNHLIIANEGEGGKTLVTVDPSGKYRKEVLSFLTGSPCSIAHIGEHLIFSYQKGDQDKTLVETRACEDLAKVVSETVLYFTVSLQAHGEQVAIVRHVLGVFLLRDPKNLSAQSEALFGKPVGVFGNILCSSYQRGFRNRDREVTIERMVYTDISTTTALLETGPSYLYKGYVVELCVEDNAVMMKVYRNFRQIFSRVVIQGDETQKIELVSHCLSGRTLRVLIAKMDAFIMFSSIKEYQLNLQELDQKAEGEAKAKSDQATF